MKFDTSIVQARLQSPLGPMIVAATASGLAGVWFEGQRHLPDCSAWPMEPDNPLLRKAMLQLQEYFAGTRTLSKNTAFLMPIIKFMCWMVTPGRFAGMCSQARFSWRLPCGLVQTKVQR